MLGIVFTELIDMLDGALGEAESERIIQAANLKSGGAYTSLGKYDFGEVVSILDALIERHGETREHWLKAFGRYLLPRFAEGHPHHFENASSSFALLEGLHDHIHAAVNKLYPTAETPHFEVEDRSDTHLVLRYRSARGLAALAVGLLEGTFAHYQEPTSIEVEDLSGGASTDVRFVLRRVG